MWIGWGLALLTMLQLRPWYLAVLSSVCALLAGCGLHRLSAREVEINWNTFHQEIDGFGASATGYVDGFDVHLAEQFFSAEKGLGLSLLRIRPIAGTEDNDCECVANNVPYHCTLGPSGQLVTGDLQVARLAAAAGLHILGVPWSPPAEMKSSGKYCAGGSIKGNPETYAKYAAELTSALGVLRDNGVSLDALSVQNEPDIENTGYDTCRWTGQQIHDFVPYLSNALDAAGFGSVKIAAPEQSEWKFDLIGPSLEDQRVASRIGLVFGHAYGSDYPSGLPAVGSRHVWQTEAGSSLAFDGSMGDGLQCARVIHNYMIIGVNAWLYWSLACGKAHFNHGNNMCLTDQRDVLTKRAYVLGQFAKFVRPGWRRIGVSNSGALLVTAFRSSEGAFAIVAINMSASAIADQPFMLNGASSLRRPVTPWVTSSVKSLHEESPVTVGADGTAFRYTIPGQSVVTFHGQID